MKTLFTFFFVFIISFAFSQNEILFFQTSWGSQLPFDEFCRQAVESGYDGVEVALPNNDEKLQELQAAVEKYKLQLIILVGTQRSGNIDVVAEQYKNNLKKAASLKPLKINSHTGSDFFTFEENLLLLSAADEAGKEINIPVFHETHRGRFSYNLPLTYDYLQQFESLHLTADFSHWMVVHERLITKDNELMKEAILKSGHIHARVGFEEGPQVNDPRAPEWKNYVDAHIDIWEEIIQNEWNLGRVATVTTEFGPTNYMPALPYTRQPVSSQWDANVYIMEKIKERISAINN